MNKIIALCICWLMYLPSNSQSQDVKSYTLTDCIDIALSNNLDLKSSQLNADASKVNYKQSRLDLIPSLNADFNVGVNDGRSINPYTNTYINQELTFSNAGLSLNAILFNGFKQLNTIKQNRLNLEASEMEIEEANQNMILAVTLRYIQVLNSKDLIELAESRLITTETQLKRLESHYTLGVGNPVDYTDMKGQYSIDKISVAQATNSFRSAVLELAKLMNLDTDERDLFQSALELINTNQYPLTANEVYEEALANLATFKSKQLRIDAADAGIKAAKGSYFPELRMFGRLSTNYSSVAQTFSESGNVISETGDFVDIANELHPVYTNKTLFDTHDIEFNEQFENNLNSVVGVSLRLPLFNGLRNKNDVSIQKIVQEESTIELENTKLNFKQSIKDAHNNMVLAFERYEILQDQVDAFTESYRVNEIRFINGVSNIVEYISSKNNMDTANLNLSKSKYEYLLRTKILDYYRGI